MERRAGWVGDVPVPDRIPLGRQHLADYRTRVLDEA
jgi:hypothetical protein